MHALVFIENVFLPSFEIIAYMIILWFSLLFIIIYNRSQSLEKQIAIRNVRWQDFKNYCIRVFSRTPSFAITSIGGNFSKTHLTRVFEKISKCCIFLEKIHFVIFSKMVVTCVCENLFFTGHSSRTQAVKIFENSQSECLRKTSQILFFFRKHYLWIFSKTLTLRVLRNFSRLLSEITLKDYFRNQGLSVFTKNCHMCNISRTLNVVISKTCKLWWWLLLDVTCDVIMYLGWSLCLCECISVSCLISWLYKLNFI